MATKEELAQQADSLLTEEESQLVIGAIALQALPDQDSVNTPDPVAQNTDRQDSLTPDTNHWLVMALHEYRALHDSIWRQRNACLDGECPCGRCIHARAALLSASASASTPDTSVRADRDVSQGGPASLSSESENARALMEPKGEE